MLICKYTSHAEADLASCSAYLQTQSNDLTIRFLDAFDKTTNFLKRSPFVGEVCPYPNPLLEGTRVWRISGFKNYLIFYRVNGSELKILRILHGSRNLESAFSDSKFSPYTNSLSFRGFWPSGVSSLSISNHSGLKSMRWFCFIAMFDVRAITASASATLGGHLG